MLPTLAVATVLNLTCNMLQNTQVNIGSASRHQRMFVHHPPSLHNKIQTVSLHTDTHRPTNSGDCSDNRMETV